MRIAIEHQTTYRYPGKVLHTAQYLHLTPRNNASQRVIDWRIQAPGQLTYWEDSYGNACHTLVEERATQEIVITAKGRVDTTDTSGVLPPNDGLPPGTINWSDFQCDTDLLPIPPGIRKPAAAGGGAGPTGGGGRSR